VQELLAPLAYIPGLVEAAASEAEKMSTESANAAVVFFDLGRVFFVENPAQNAGPLTFLGRFVYDERGILVEICRDVFPSSLKIERARNLVSEKRFEQAERFLRKSLIEDHRQDGRLKCAITLCTFLVAHSSSMYKGGAEINSHKKFEEAIRLFSDLAEEIKHAADTSEVERELQLFWQEYELYGLLIRNDGKIEDARRIFQSALVLNHSIYGADDSHQRRWQELISESALHLSRSLV
jgi:tetratricopeptide (TPR) repeat protein